MKRVELSANESSRPVLKPVPVNPVAIQQAFANRYGARSGTSYTSESIESDFSSLPEPKERMQPVLLAKRRTYAPQVEVASKPKFSNMFPANEERQLLDSLVLPDQKSSANAKSQRSGASRSSGVSCRRTFEQER